MTWQPGLCVCALGGYCSLFELAAPSVTASDAVPHLRGFPRSCLFAEQQSGFLPNRPRPYLPFPWQQARRTLLELDHAGTVCGMQPPLTACCVSTREWQRWLLGPACITVVDWLLRWQCKHRHCQGCKVPVSRVLSHWHPSLCKSSGAFLLEQRPQPSVLTAGNAHLVGLVRPHTTSS